MHRYRGILLIITGDILNGYKFNNDIAAVFVL